MQAAKSSGTGRPDPRGQPSKACFSFRLIHDSRDGFRVQFFFFLVGGVDVAVSSLEALAGSDRAQEAQGRQLGRLLEIQGCGLGFIVGNKKVGRAD